MVTMATLGVYAEMDAEQLTGIAGTVNDALGDE